MKGNIVGAGLNVFENVVLSTHFAVFSKESFEDLFEVIVGNLEFFFSNKPFITPLL